MIADLGEQRKASSTDDLHIHVSKSSLHATLESGNFEEARAAEPIAWTSRPSLVNPSSDLAQPRKSLDGQGPDMPIDTTKGYLEPVLTMVCVLGVCLAISVEQQSCRVSRELLGAKRKPRRAIRIAAGYRGELG